jgi:ribosomal protein S18 acetylase RimI-like enzyme
MQIRPYTAADRDGCLAVFDGNTPPFFAPHERSGFERFLAAPNADYWVAVDDAGAVIGCGGHYVIRERGEAGLAWGLVDRSQHGRGVGRALLDFRLALLRANADVRVVTLQTSQHTQGFFAKAGFVTDAIIPDHFAPGLHRVDMHLDV